MSHRPFFMLVRLCVIALGLFGLLTFAIGGCRTVAQSPIEENSPPHLLTLIELLPHASYPGHMAVVTGKPAYVVNASGSVAVVDGPTLQAIVPIHEGMLNGSIIAHPQNNMVYVTNLLSNSVHILEGTAVYTTLTLLGTGPYAVTVNPITGYVYVGNTMRVPMRPDLRSSVTVISGTQVITDIPIAYITTELNARQIAANPANAQVYVGQQLRSQWPMEGQGLLAVLDDTRFITSTSLEVADADHNDGLHDIAVHPETGEVYGIVNLGSLLYWDGESEQAIRLRLGSMGFTGLHDIAIDPTRNFVYVTSWSDPQSYVVVLHQDEIITAIPVGRDPREVIYDATHDYTYIVSRLANEMTVIRGTEVITTLPTQGRGATYIAVDEQRGYIYVSNVDSHSIAVFGFETPEPPLLFLPNVNR